MDAWKILMIAVLAYLAIGLVIVAVLAVKSGKFVAITGAMKFVPVWPILVLFWILGNIQ